MDETGSTSAVVVNVPSTTSVTVMDATASALASLIAPISDAVLVKIRYSYRCDQPNDHYDDQEFN